MADLPHLPLKRVEFEAPRRKHAFGKSNGRDFKRHGKKLDSQVQGALTAFQGHRPPQGVNPALVLRVKLSDHIDEDVWRKAGLTLLGQEDENTLLLFSSDADLLKFRLELNAYREGPKEGRKNAPYAGIFNNIESVGSLGPADRIGRLFRSDGVDKPAKFVDGQTYTVDLELWHTGDVSACYERIGQLKTYIEASGGRMPDNYVGPSIVLARVKASGALVKQLLELDIVSSLDLPPRASILIGTQLESGVGDFGKIPSPPADAASVCVIDSGITSGHPLLATAIGEAAAGPGGSATDEHGHGTMVAGLALYGDVQACITAGQFIPTLQIHSARVLNASNEFDDESLITTQMRKAVEYFKTAYGCRVFNASLGDKRTPYNGGKVSPWASILDHLARELDVVIVVSAGNYTHAPTARETPDHHLTGYPRYLLEDPAKIIEPATGCIVLTVGALASTADLPPADAGGVRLRPIALADQPSPFTRSGPGIGKAIKPEVCDYGGNIAYNTTFRRTVDVDELSVISTNKDYLARLFQANYGTSFAAPRIAHLAGRLVAEFPGRSANLIRALIASSAEVPEAADALLNGIAGDAALKLCGYGRPAASRALASTANRAVLIAENHLPFDKFHIYEVPIPDEIYTVAGVRRISVSLAFDPPVRHSRLDYLGTRMSFRLIRGKTLDEVAAAFSKLPTAEVDEKGEKMEPEKVEAIKGSANCALLPSPTVREGSTLQKAVFTISRTPNNYGETYFLVVRCQREWALDAHGPQTYALAVSIEHSAAVDLYATIQARVRVPVRVKA